MPESENGPPAPHQPERDAAREARQKWAQEVTHALDERRMSIHAAAKAIGISPGRLQAWLSQDVEPSPRVMGDLARVIGRGHLHLLQLLDWLPRQLGDVPLRLEASEKLHEAVAEASRWLHSAEGAVGEEDGTAVAGALLKLSNDWEVRLRNVTKGLKYRVRHSTQLGFSPAPHGQGEPSADAQVNTAMDRQEIIDLAYDAIERTWSRWPTQDEVGATGSEFARPDLVLASPVLCAARSRGLRPNLRVPPSIAVFGIPLFGSQEVAALVAGMLDWAYFDLVCAVREMQGPDIEASIPSRNRAQIRMARRLLQGPDTVGKLTVWSCDGATPILQTFREIGEDLPLVVLLLAPDSTLEYAIRRLNVDGRQAADDLETAQNVARRTLTSRRDAHTYLLLDLPELDRASDPANNADDLFDAYVELAFRVADWLHDQHGAPRLCEASGILSELKRRSGREDDSSRP